MIRLLDGAWVIGRRDFNATVLSKAFIFFLLGPLFPLLLGGVFGGIGAQVATRTEQPVIAVMFPDQDFKRLSAARDQLARAMGGPGVVRLVQRAPMGNFDAQVRGLLQSRNPPVRAVLTGGLDRPHLTGAVDQGTLGQLRLIVAEARAPAAPRTSPGRSTCTRRWRSRCTASGGSARATSSRSATVVRTSSSSGHGAPA